MRQVEPWLDTTGWGATWPVLKDRDPDPDHREPSLQNANNVGPVVPTQVDKCDENSGDEDGGEDADMSEIEDNDGEDPE